MRKIILVAIITCSFVLAFSGVRAEDSGSSGPKDAGLRYGINMGAGYTFKGTGNKEATFSSDGGIMLVMKQFGVELNSLFRFNRSGQTHVTETGIDLRGRYYFLNKAFSPFAIINAGAHYYKVTGYDSKWGFASGAGAGVSYDVSMFEIPLTVRYQYLMLPGIKDAQAIIATLGIYY